MCFLSQILVQRRDCHSCIISASRPGQPSRLCGAQPRQTLTHTRLPLSAAYFVFFLPRLMIDWVVKVVSVRNKSSRCLEGNLITVVRCCFAVYPLSTRHSRGKKTTSVRVDLRQAAPFFFFFFSFILSTRVLKAAAAPERASSVQAVRTEQQWHSQIWGCEVRVAISRYLE